MASIVKLAVDFPSRDRCDLYKNGVVSTLHFSLFVTFEETPLEFLYIYTYIIIDFRRECSVQNVGFRSQTAYGDGNFVCLYSNAFSFAFLNLYLRSERMMIIGRGLKKVKKD